MEEKEILASWFAPVCSVLQRSTTFHFSSLCSQNLLVVRGKKPNRKQKQRTFLQASTSDPSRTREVFSTGIMLYSGSGFLWLHKGAGGWEGGRVCLETLHDVAGFEGAWGSQTEKQQCYVIWDSQARENLWTEIANTS